MTIENLLERIALANEAQAVQLARIAKANEAAQGVFTAAKAEVEKSRDPIPEKVVEKEKAVKEPSYAEKRKAELAAEPVVVKAKPGRPAKVKEVAPVVEKEPEIEEDPFAEAADEPVVEDEPAAPATQEDVRAVMVELRNKAGKEKAFTVLRDAGGGAAYLPGSKQAGVAGGAGELKEKFFGAVVKAAKAALAA